MEVGEERDLQRTILVIFFASIGSKMSHRMGEGSMPSIKTSSTGSLLLINHISIELQLGRNIIPGIL